MWVNFNNEGRPTYRVAEQGILRWLPTLILKHTALEQAEIERQEREKKLEARMKEIKEKYQFNTEVILKWNKELKEMIEKTGDVNARLTKLAFELGEQKT